MARLLIMIALTAALAACESTQQEIRSTHYGPPNFINGFDIGGYSPAPFGTFKPTDNINQAPELGRFHGASLPEGWKGFTGN